jgi:Leucine-rich repeat (LRR) protein
MIAVLGAGCQGYSYTLNQRALFEPPPLFADYSIDDRALSDCVQQAIEDGRISSVEQLENLNCSNAGIASLAGLESFTGLRRVGLDGNALRTLSPLGTLAKLELVQARNNRLEGVDAALCHGGRQFALAGNALVPCADIERLRACGATLIDVPAQCATP